jgi:hypothetical protein
MMRRDANLKKIVRLVHSLEDELKTVESALHMQFETTASLKEKLLASKRARSAVSKSRRLCADIAQSLAEPDQ